MAKFDTRVAGVTYQNVDFSSIKKSSRVDIVPEPDCPYDDNALKVVINGNHVGYLKKGFNRTIWREIDRGSKVTARVQAVIGGGPGQNKGIALRIIVDDGFTNSRSSGDLSPISKPAPSGIQVFSAIPPMVQFLEPKKAWIDFLEAKKNLSASAPMPEEPDYLNDYDRDVPFLTRLWAESFDSYKSRRRQGWLQSCSAPAKKNEQREKKLKQLNAKRSALKPEYEIYMLLKKRQQYLQKIHASTVSESVSANSAYTTVYERSIFDLLRQKLKNVFHQTSIDGSSVDILCLADDFSNAWAIEIDGGIHRRQTQVERDQAVQRKLKRLGVSLIRVPNSMVSRDPEECVKQILGAIERKPVTPTRTKTRIDSILDCL